MAVTHSKLISGYLSSVTSPNETCVYILSLWCLIHTHPGMFTYESMCMTFCHALVPEPHLVISKHTEIKLRLLELVDTTQAGSRIRIFSQSSGQVHVV